MIPRQFKWLSYQLPIFNHLKIQLYNDVYITWQGWISMKPRQPKVNFHYLKVLVLSFSAFTMMVLVTHDFDFHKYQKMRRHN